jgi:hypothetical protein
VHKCDFNLKRSILTVNSVLTTSNGDLDTRECDFYRQKKCDFNKQCVILTYTCVFLTLKSLILTVKRMSQRHTKRVILLRLVEFSLAECDFVTQQLPTCKIEIS